MVGGIILEMVKMSKKRTDIPNPRTPGALAVTDGTIFVGHIVVQADTYFAFGADDTLIGKYGSQSAAMRAIPAAGTGKAAS
jgi:hypothetical protein